MSLQSTLRSCRVETERKLKPIYFLETINLCPSRRRLLSAQVYHTFHDEVDEYRRHWWRCDGPCRHRKPYYGYVKRATNRAPSAHDYWWAEHQQTCGGTYVKIKEPENYARKGKGKARPGRQPAAAGRKGTSVCPSASDGTAADGAESRRRPREKRRYDELRIVSGVDVCKCGLQTIPFFSETVVEKCVLLCMEDG